MTATTRVTAGFLPLLDSALLVAAKENGFAEDEHLDLRRCSSDRGPASAIAWRGDFKLRTHAAPMPMPATWPVALVTPLIV